MPHMLTSGVTKIKDKIKAKNSFLDQIKLVEQAIKDRRRDIKKMELKINESQNLLEKQKHIADSVMTYFNEKVTTVASIEVFPTNRSLGSNFDSLQSKQEVLEDADS